MYKITYGCENEDGDCEWFDTCEVDEKGKAQFITSLEKGNVSIGSYPANYYYVEDHTGKTIESKKIK